MKIERLLRPQTILFALCLGAAPAACAVENDDDDDDGAGDDEVDVEVDDDGGDDADELESCQAECEDDACLVNCETKFTNG